MGFYKKTACNLLRTGNSHGNVGFCAGRNELDVSYGDTSPPGIRTQDLPYVLTLNCVLIPPRPTTPSTTSVRASTNLEAQSKHKLLQASVRWKKVYEVPDDLIVWFLAEERTTSSSWCLGQFIFAMKYLEGNLL